MMKGRGVLFVLGALLAWPGAAEAARISMSGSTVTYRAASGEVNRVEVSATTVVGSTADSATFEDGGSYPVTRGPGCAPYPAAGPRATICGTQTSVNRVRVITGSGPDRVFVSYALGRFALDAFGGSGFDRFVLQSGDDIDVAAGSDPDQIRVVAPARVAGLFLRGNGGNDTIVGSPERDTIRGGPGDDRLVARGGPDLVNGEGGADRILAGAGDDVVFGLTGADTVFGDLGRDVIQGGSGNDRLLGGADGDSVFGGPDADRLDGGAGDDHVNGQGGSDAVIGGPGTDRLYGGGANDAVSSRDGVMDAVINCGPGGMDLLVHDPFERQLAIGCERL